MDRVTINILQVNVDYINRRFMINDRELVIDHYSPGGNPYTYKLAEATPKGGKRDLTSYRMTAREFKTYLDGLIEGLGWHERS